MLTRRSSAASLVLATIATVPLAAQTTTLVSENDGPGASDGSSTNPAVSAGGRFVAFESSASNLVPNDTNSRSDIFVRDLATATTIRISVAPGGGNSNETSSNPRISGRGRYVAFESFAGNLVPGDTNLERNVFVRDWIAGTTVCVDVTLAGTPSLRAFLGSMSDDGRFVAFDSGSNNIVPGDTNGDSDVFVRDLQNGQTTRVSVSGSGAQGNNESTGGSVSDDGRYVAFRSFATNLVAGDTNNWPDIFVRDLWSGVTTRVSVSASGAQVFNLCEDSSLSGDGRFVAFESYADNLVPGDTNGFADVFQRDLLTGAIERVSVNSSGGQANDHVSLSGTSFDGRAVVMFSLATNLVPDDTNNKADVFVHDRVTGATTRVNLGNAQNQANDHASNPGMSADGRFVAFGSRASNLVPPHQNSVEEVYLRDRGVPTTGAFCFGDGTQSTACPCGNNGALGRGCENSAATGGARLTTSGFADPDSALLSASGLLPDTLAMFLQGNAQLGQPVPLGDGLRCAGGNLARLYFATASGGVVTVPMTGQLPLGAQSAFLGVPITPGSTRYYQVWYRDPDASFCAAPQGNLWNVSNGVRIDW